jgi:ABC-2 type transport system permease protein
MSATVAHTFYMAERHMVALLRQPWWIVVTLTQPLIWLFLFGQLFKSVVEIPGFGGSYIDFLAPGVVVSSGLFAGSWAGMSTLEDMERGVFNRFLITPASRTSIIAGALAQSAVVVAVQGVILTGSALLLGASFPGGIVGILVMLVLSAAFGAAIGTYSHALALLTRREDTMIAIATFISMPTMFLSSLFMRIDLAPGWIQTAASLNPLHWTVEAVRATLAGNADWSSVLLNAIALAAFAALGAVFASFAFRKYQQSM